MRRKKYHVLISAGPTIEDLDPVRFLSNRSTGKMGYALAEAALKSGHKVTLVSGPTALTPPPGCRVFAVRSAKQMASVIQKQFPKANVIIKTAAVSDYRPVKIVKKKIKKQNAKLFLELKRNPDILKSLGKKKKNHQILVGFAAETHSLLKNALKKMKEKKLDWLVVNDVSKKETGFAKDHNEVTLLSKKGLKIPLAKDTKKNIARKILKYILGTSEKLYPCLPAGKAGR